jgi:hypothetical protein
MALNLSLTVKNITLLKDYFQKFNKNKIGTNILTILYSDRMVTKSCSNDKDFIKVSTIPLSEIFEEAQLDIEEPIFICLFEKQNRINKYMSKFKNGAKFNISYGQINSKKILQLVSNIHPDVDGVVNVADKISFSDKVLNLKFKTSSIEMVTTIFKLSDDLLNQMTSIKKPNSLYSSTDVDVETMGNLQGLISDINNSDSKDARGFIVKTNKDGNVQLSIEKYFDIKLESMVKSETIKLFPINFSSVLDNEEYTLNLLNVSLEKGVFDIMLWKSNESDTYTIIACLNGIEATSDEEGEVSSTYEDDSIDVDDSDFDFGDDE